MAQGGGSQAATVAAEQASQQPGNSLLQHMNFRGHEAEAVNQEQPEHILGHHEEEDGVRGTRYLRNPTVMSASGYPHHPHEQVYDPMENTDFERYQQRPVDLGNYNRQSYSPNSAHTASALVAAEGWTHHLQAAVANPDWVDARAGHQAAAAGIPWPPHSHDNRYSTASMKWEPNTGVVGVGALSGGGNGYKKSKTKLCSPGAHSTAGGSTSGLSIASDVIPDETLAHLTVKELNKRVQNLARDEVVALKQRRRTLKNRGMEPPTHFDLVVALKQRRRTLKNRGYAMTCRMRRQENRENLEHQVQILTEKLHKVSSERDYYRAQWERLNQATAAMAVTRTASNPGLLNGGAPTDLTHMGAGHPTVGGQLDLSLSGTAAAAAAAAAAAQQHHEDYKRDGYPNNNDLKLNLRRF